MIKISQINHIWKCTIIVLILILMDFAYYSYFGLYLHNERYFSTPISLAKSPNFSALVPMKSEIVNLRNSLVLNLLDGKGVID